MDTVFKRFEAFKYLNVPGRERYHAICSYLYSSYLTGHHFRTFQDIYDMFLKEGVEVEPNNQELVDRIVTPHLSFGATLCTDTESAFMAYAKTRGIPHEALNISKGSP